MIGFFSCFKKLKNNKGSLVIYGTKKAEPH